ncbi:MAG: PAS domain S-box protein, partial [Elainellaceae cyanobacterium]
AVFSTVTLSTTYPRTSMAHLTVLCMSSQSSLAVLLEQELSSICKILDAELLNHARLDVRTFDHWQAALDVVQTCQAAEQAIPIALMDCVEPDWGDRFWEVLQSQSPQTVGISLVEPCDSADALFQRSPSHRLLLKPLHRPSLRLALHQALRQYALAIQQQQHHAQLAQINQQIVQQIEQRTQALAEQTHTHAQILHEQAQLEETLRQSEAKFSIAFRASPVILSITDLSDRRYIEVNNRFLETFGYERDEVVGRTTLEFNNWNNLDSREQFRQLLQEQGVVRGQEHEFVTKSGQIITGIVSADIIPVNGNPCILSVIEDITQRKQIEQALKQAELNYRSIFENAIDGIFQTTTDGRYLAANLALVQLYGYATTEEFLESQFNASDLYSHPNRRAEFLAILHQEDLITNFESEIRRRDGSHVWISETARVVRDANGDILYYEGLVRDISDRKRAELALQAAKESADAANKAKSEFLANMSHELRTPLNAVIGFTQIMLRDSNISNEHRENLEIIHRAGEHLLDLINDVLEMSKIEAGKTVLSSDNVDLYGLLEALHTMMQLRAEGKGVDLNVAIAPDVPRYVNTDQRKLRQVLLNLLSNAIKFTEAGCVTLRAWVPSQPKLTSPPTPWMIQFEVIDTGVGIADHELDSLFEAFAQTESGRLSNQGTGLGLPISRKFIQLMGGEITVRSTPHQGSQFQFYIQAMPVSATDVQPQISDRRVIGLVPGLPQYRILVVDDKWENRQLLMKLLTPIGLLVREAEHGQAAIAIWEEWDPHLIWMDMRMPVMDGYEATKQIRASLKGQATVILALTASALEEEKLVVLSAGCNDFVRKPFREADLFSKMADYLGLRYVYEEQAIAPPVTLDPLDLTPEDLSVMPPTWIQELYTAARSGDDEYLHGLIQDIPSCHASLINGLTDLTNNFHFDHITQLASLQHD